MTYTHMRNFAIMQGMDLLKERERERYGLIDVLKCGPSIFTSQVN